MKPPRFSEEDFKQMKRVRAEGRSVKEQAHVPLGTLAAPSPSPMEKALLPTEKVRGLKRQQSVAESGDRDVSTVRPSPYKSKLEASFANRLIAMHRAGEIDGWLYEPFTFKLAEGKRYRVDFVSWKFESRNGGEYRYYTTAYECKGWHKNYRDSLTHLKWAAQRFPFFAWMKVVSNGKRGFEIMDVVV